MNMATYFSLIISGIALLTTILRNTKKDGSEFAAMQQSLADIKAQQVTLLERTSLDHDKIIKMEMNIDAIWRRLDEK